MVWWFAASFAVWEIVSTDQLFISERFLLAARGHPEWIRASDSGGANPLWPTEWLAGAGFGLWQGGVFDLSAAGVWGGGLGDGCVD